jgi:DDE superfamily endonuclease
MALEYLKHFHRHARPIGVYRLLILNGHDSYATFRFKELAHKYKIILLYLPAHTTHRLQPLDVGIFGPQSGFYSNEVVQHSRWAGFNVSKREYLDWMLAARKKTNITSNIFSAWKKAGLIPFNPDFVLEALPKVKKYISGDQPTPIEPQSELAALETRSSSRPMIPAD